MHADQKGSLILVMAVALLMIGTATAIGLHVQSNRNASKSDSPGPVKPMASDSPTAQKSNSNLSESESQFLSINDARIKIALTEAMHDLTYTVSLDKERGIQFVAFSTASFVKESIKFDYLTNNDGSNSCTKMANIIIYPTDQRGLLEQDPIQSYEFDSNGKPTSSTGIKQLSDKRYAISRGPHSTCVRNADAQFADKERQVRILLKENLLKNIDSL